MEALVKFIKPKYDTVNYTHTIQIKEKTFPIKIEDEEVEKLSRLITECEEVKLRERFKAENPIIMEIEKKGEITEEQKKKLVASLQFVVTTSYKIDNDEILLTIVHEEKDKVTLIMPYCKVQYNCLRKDIRDAYIYILDKKKVMGEETHGFILNKNVYNTPFWISRPIKELEFYSVLNDNNFNQYEALDYYNALKNEMVNEDMFSNEQEGINKLLSFNGYDRQMLERNTNQTNKNTTTSELISERKQEKIKSDLEIVIELKQFLDKSRCNVQSGFQEIGQCLFNISEGNEYALSIWKNIASETSNQDLCEKYWATFKKTQTTLGTFRYWCSQDDPKGYAKWKENNITDSLWMCLNPTAAHSEIANVMFKMYQDRFICASIKDQLWYEFQGHKYEELDGGYSLRILLSTEVAKKFESILDECNVVERDTPNSSPDKQKWQKKQEACLSIIKGLKTSAYKNAIMKEASEKFYDRHFLKNMNMNGKIFVLDNGVLDLERVHLDPNPDTWLRPGRPEDRSTISCGYSYKSYTADHPDVKFCNEYLEKVFVDEPIRNYVKRFIGSCIESGNKEKIVPIWTGTGNNSKSILELLVEKIFGDGYCAKPPSALLTAKDRTSPGSATPEYEVLRYAKICFFQEVKGSINESVLKELSSGCDSFYSRALNKMPTKIIPQFTPVVVCNKIPTTDGSDPAIALRLRVVEFLSTFSRNAPENPDDQKSSKIFPIDLNFQSKIPSMIQPLLWIFLNEYAAYKKEGLITPKEVELATITYKESNDFFAQFLDDKLEKIDKSSPDFKTSFVKVDTLYQAYKLWYKDSFPDAKVQSKMDFKDDMRKHGYIHQSLRYYGVKIRT